MNLFGSGVFGLEESGQLVEILKQVDDGTASLIMSKSGLSKINQECILSEAGHSASLAATETSEVTATASTTGLSLAFKGLAASLGISTTALGAFLGIAAALGAGFLIYKQVQKHNEELRQSAVDSLEAYKDTARSIDEYKNKIKELRDELDSGNLTESEAASKKAELISISLISQLCYNLSMKLL